MSDLTEKERIDLAERITAAARYDETVMNAPKNLRAIAAELAAIHNEGRPVRAMALNELEAIASTIERLSCGVRREVGRCQSAAEASCWCCGLMAQLDVTGKIAQRYKRERDETRAELRRLRKSARALLAKLELTAKAESGVYAMAAVHGYLYHGPTTVAECASLRAVLGEGESDAE